MAFFDQDGPRVFAHRGGRALGPENTLEAFDRGLRAGADGLELDVRLSADGHPVVIHDATLDRTTDGTGPVRARTARELARVDAAARFVPDLPELPGGQGGPVGPAPLRGAGIGIPTLADVLARFPDRPLIIEMKDNLSELGEAVARTVRAAGAADRVCAAGFGPLAARAARRALPEMAASAYQAEVRLALYRSWAAWPVRRPPYQGYQVPEAVGRLRVVSPRFVRHAHRAGLRVQVWTVDHEDDMVRLLGWGVDALITDRPDRAARVVGQARDKGIR